MIFANRILQRIAKRKALLLVNLKVTTHPIGNQQQEGRIATKRERQAANGAVRQAIRKGTLLRKRCELCGAYPAEAHHEDYSKPFEIRWFCRLHHSRHHAGIKSKRKMRHKTT